MRVSVVIPALDEERLIKTAVLSACSAGADEIIVVDGGSQDRTWELARQTGVITLRAPRGRASQQNVGAVRATGDVLLFVHADTALGLDCISQARVAIGSGYVHGAFRQRINASGAAYRLLETGNARRVRNSGLPYGDQGIFVTKAIFLAAGGFPAKRLMEDWLLMRQLRRQHWPALMPGPIYVSARRWQRYGIARQTMKNQAFSWAAWLGFDPDILARGYPPHSQPRKDVPPVPNSPAISTLDSICKHTCLKSKRG